MPGKVVAKIVLWGSNVLVTTACVIGRQASCSEATPVPGHWSHYTNQSAQYIVSYPTNWFWTQAYRNAFELRNHDEQHPVLQKNEAVILFTEEGILNAERAERRVKDLIDAAAAGREFHLEKTNLEGHLFYHWSVLQKAATPAKDKGKPMARAELRLRVGSALITEQLIRAEGSAWATADPSVIREIKQIENSIQLIKQPTKKGISHETK